MTASVPFDGLEALESPRGPDARRREPRRRPTPATRGHVAVEWTERIPGARMISEDEGESPLAWQGGKLSREIAAFCEEPAVRERLPA